MSNRILFPGCNSGFSWHYDPDQSKNRHSVILWNAAPTGWPVIPDKPLISLLFSKKKDLHMEQKKATQWVASKFSIG